MAHVRLGRGSPPAPCDRSIMSQQIIQSAAGTEENHWRVLSVATSLIGSRSGQARDAGGIHRWVLSGRLNCLRTGTHECGLEAPSGFEPLHRSFADCSLSHLGTAPCADYTEPVVSLSAINGQFMTEEDCSNKT